MWLRLTASVQRERAADWSSAAAYLGRNVMTGLTAHDREWVDAIAALPIADTARAALTPDAPAVEPLEVVAGVLQSLWGCAPGDYIMGDLPDPDTGDAMPAPVGQMCRSGAHNHAYWGGDCQFASEAAAAVLDALGTGAGQAAVDALDEVVGRIDTLRNERWQQHLRDHPLSDGTSCPGDYATHDALRAASEITRNVRAAVTSADDGDRDE